MGKNEPTVHPSAIVHPQAKLASGVHVGPFSLIGKGVSIGPDTWIDAHVRVEGVTEIGGGCRFFPYSVIGSAPQDVAYKQEPTRLRIGNRNVFREFMTVHRGSGKGDGLTEIGSDNYFMAYSHIAHDCRVGNHIIFINGATLGGHCRVDDYAQLSAFSGVHQFCRIGKYAFVGGYSVITQDVLPFCKLAGSRPPHIFGPNSIGLRRLGFSRDRIKAIKAMFHIIFLSGLNTTQAVKKIEEEIPAGEDREEILGFVQESKRGFVKKPAEEWKKDLA